MKELIHFVKGNIVFVIAFFAAVITSIIVPPDSAYLTYFDFKTLACLFSVLAVVCALKNVNFFYLLSAKIIKSFKNLRGAVLALVFTTLIGSMFIANDMALLTFLPLGYLVLRTTSNERYMAHVFIMQNIAANLGGMLTPFGNPQNLFLYTKFEISNGEFVKIMLLPFLLSVVIIFFFCVFLPKTPLTIPERSFATDKRKTYIYLVLFVLAILIVFRTIPYPVGVVVIVLFLCFLDKKALKMVDYPLLLTFVCFFIFSGNMARIDVVKDFFESLLNKNVLLVSTLSCQFISNVPTAILLSEFTENYRDLLIGVNIGGIGTLISSLASLITFREYTHHNPKKAFSYLCKFSLYNFSILIILVLFEMFL
ncbi:MAG: citrate transporter [Ruminococcaceae bacterium]|nr:citrate transporter [Oscillospiraceae bacterium]